MAGVGVVAGACKAVGEAGLIGRETEALAVAGREERCAAKVAEEAAIAGREAKLCEAAVNARYV